MKRSLWAVGTWAWSNLILTTGEVVQKRCRVRSAKYVNGTPYYEVQGEDRSYWVTHELAASSEELDR